MNQPATNNEKELLLQVANGNEQAFAELFHLYTPKIFPFALKIVRNEPQAREIVQETFIRLWIKRETLPQVDNPSAFIFRVVSNISVSYLRALGRKQRVLNELQGLTAPASNGLEEVDARQLNSYIRQAVTALPEKRQRIYRMSRELGLSHQQIADELGLSINTVKDQVSKALRSIQEHIRDYTGLSSITVMLILSF